jgi:hypothetical protein
MIAEETRDGLLIANLVASQLFAHEPAEVNDGVPVVPARSLGIAALAQPHGQPKGRCPERGLPQRTSNSPFQNASCIAYLHDLCWR